MPCTNVGRSELGPVMAGDENDVAQRTSVTVDDWDVDIGRNARVIALGGFSATVAQIFVNHESEYL